MCLITFAYDHHPDFFLILAANRDEFYQRPAREAKFWEAEGMPELLAGRDLKAGGTWMGVAKTGKWGAITNYRDMKKIKENTPSRGEILPEFLTSKRSAGSYLDQHSGVAEEYNGYNLLLGDGKDLHYFSNQNMTREMIKPGIHGISNAFLNTPWPKVEQAKAKLDSLISGSFDKEDLFDLLMTEDKAPADQLPDTGLEPEWEKALSSIFISIDGYGTRCSTLLLIDREGSLSFTERRYEPGSSKTLDENNFVIPDFIS
ncbi:NRDE family protein [Balneola sp. MJW-20]|uniref:NRDE family protein n=1 Tax=Gracilimonas aurantiaca TaxID=3234185 RepID=UPI0034651527